MEQTVNKNTTNEFYTKDLNEAGAILVSNIKLLRLEREHNYYWFVFENKNTQAICNNFWSQDLSVDAKKYSDALRTLKDRLFAQR